jgi:hypothetical protein
MTNPITDHTSEVFRAQVKAIVSSVNSLLDALEFLCKAAVHEQVPIEKMAEAIMEAVNHARTSMNP